MASPQWPIALPARSRRTGGLRVSNRQTGSVRARASTGFLTGGPEPYRNMTPVEIQTFLQYRPKPICISNAHGTTNVTI